MPDQYSEQWFFDVQRELPYDTLINFWRDPVRAWATDESSVVVASAEQVAAARDLDHTFEDQVCSADLLVLAPGSVSAAENIGTGTSVTQLAAVRRSVREVERGAALNEGAVYGRDLDLAAGLATPLCDAALTDPAPTLDRPGGWPSGRRRRS